MNRRDLMRTALAGAAGATAPAQHAHPPAAKPAKGAASWKPLLFDAHQNATVVALTDLILPQTDTPGAKAARANEYIDLILHDGSAARRNAFLQGLGWLDGYAISQHRSPFVTCSREQQVAMLTRLERASDPALRPGAQFFAEAKRLTVSGYYTSREGIAELNKGGRVPASFGCRKGDH